jgi:tetratricopeptide (TPR) repeat protein
LEKTNKLALKKLKSISSDSFFFLPSNLKIMSIIKSLNKKNDYKNLLFSNFKIWPKNKYILYKLATYYKTKKQYRKSIKIYKKIIDIYGESDRDLFFYASNLDKIGKWKKAKTLLLNLLKRNPKDTYTLNYISYKLALREQDLNLALNLIKQALAIDPENGFFLDTLGWVEFKRKNYNKAVFFLEKSISILPRSSEILDHLGDCYLMLNRKKEAMFEWKKAIKYEIDTNIIKNIQAKLKRYE